MKPQVLSELLATVIEASESYLFLLGPLIMITFKTNKIQLNQDPSFQRKRILNKLQMFNIIYLYVHLSIDSNIAMWADAHNSWNAFADF